MLGRDGFCWGNVELNVMSHLWVFKTSRFLNPLLKFKVLQRTRCPQTKQAEEMDPQVLPAGIVEAQLHF